MVFEELGVISQMWIEEVTPERLAEILHHYQQALGVVENVPENKSWERMPQPEKSRCVAAARLTLLELDSTKHHESNPSPYYAEPGKAEWGC